MQVDLLPTFALGFALGQLFCLLWMHLLILRDRPAKGFTPASGPKIPRMDKAGRNPPPPKSFMKPQPTPEPPPKKP
ncbi:Uncharacterised protein [Yersinia kristensenii]|nr:Uncharacterised protein [Yersinia kristensenii]